MTENFLKIQEVQNVPKKMNPKKPKPRHIIKMSKVEDKARLLKVAREKQLVIHKRIPPHKTISRLLSKNVAAQKWHDIFKVLKGKHFQPRIL